MDSVIFDKIFLSKKKYFKNIQGQYCFINYLNDKLVIDFPPSEVLFDVDFSYPKPNVIIKLTPEVSNFIDTIDKKLASLTEGYQYCSLRKVAPVGKKYSDTLKLKIVQPEIQELLKKTKVNLKIHISGLWYDQYSCGPYFNIVSIDSIASEKKCLINVESDSDIEIN
jgi:hypothetical protein